MTKQDLIQNLKLCKQKIGKRDSLRSERAGWQNELNKIRQIPTEKPAEKSTDVSPFSFMTFAVAGGTTAWTFYISLYVLSTRSSIDSFISLAFCAFLGVLAGVLVGILVGWYTVKRKKENIIEENQIAMANWERRRTEEPDIIQRLNACSTALKQAESQVQSQARLCGLHPDYQNSTALIYIISYLETGRCDTLKEALNKYEAERREDAYHDAIRGEMRKSARRQEAQLEAIRQETSRGADAAEDAADAAHDAAFWSAANTFIVASEIDRQRRKDS